MPETSCLEVPPSVLSVQKLLVLLSGNWVFTLGIQWGCWPGKYRKGTVQILDTDLERVYRSMAFLLHHVTLFILVSFLFLRYHFGIYLGWMGTELLQRFGGPRPEVFDKK